MIFFAVLAPGPGSPQGRSPARSPSDNPSHSTAAENKNHQPGVQRGEVPLAGAWGRSSHLLPRRGAAERAPAAATEVSGTRPGTTYGAQAEGAAGPQRADAPYREHGQGLRGSEASPDAARTPGERGHDPVGARRSRATGAEPARRPADQQTRKGRRETSRPGARAQPPRQRREGGAGARPGAADGLGRDKLHTRRGRGSEGSGSPVGCPAQPEAT